MTTCTASLLLAAALLCLVVGCGAFASAGRKTATATAPFFRPAALNVGLFIDGNQISGSYPPATHESVFDADVVGSTATVDDCATANDGGLRN